MDPLLKAPDGEPWAFEMKQAFSTRVEAVTSRVEAITISTRFNLLSHVILEFSSAPLHAWLGQVLKCSPPVLCRGPRLSSVQAIVQLILKWWHQAVDRHPFLLRKDT